MKTVAFIGGFDKFDIMLYTAIIISNQLKTKCLIVDSTIQEKARYIVPTIDNKNYVKQKYITTFQGVDIAVGFKTREELVEFGILNEENKYEYMFVDLDEVRTLESLNLGQEDLIFLATAFDLYSLNKAFSILDNTTVTLPIHKILFAKKIKNTYITFMENVTNNRNINWGKYNIQFPYDNGDWTEIYENQRENRLTLTKFSNRFKSGIKTLVKIITESSGLDTSRTMRGMEKLEKR